MLWLMGLYVAGVVLGLLATDGTMSTKAGLAVLWPLGVLAFAATITVLVIVGSVAFPLFGAILAAAVLAWFWF